MQWIMDHQALMLGFLFALSEMLASIPGVGANSVFQLIQNALKGAVSKSSGGSGGA